MHVHFLDPYQGRDSLVHRLDPRVKFVLAVAFILAGALTPPGAWPVYILLFSILFAAELLSEVGVGYILKRSSLALPFVLAALPVLATVAGSPLFTLQIGSSHLVLTREGLNRFGSIAFRSWISVQMAILLAASTPFPDLLAAMRAVKLPRLLVAIIGLMWRYLFVLADEALRLLRAREARSGYAPLHAGKPGGTLAWRARVAGGMAGNLFVRSFDRADRIYAAMASRGYDGEVRTVPLPPVTPGQGLILGLGLLLLALLVLLAHLF